MIIDNYEDLPSRIEFLDDKEWEILTVYRDALKLVVKASEVLEGRDYPSSSSVIPFLDAIIDELKNLLNKDISQEAKRFVNILINNIHSDRRFHKDLYKTQPPYNVLTLLDVRYGDLYMDEEQKEKAINDLVNDRIFSSYHKESPNIAQTVTVAVQPNPELTPLQRRRAQLVSGKTAATSAGVNNNIQTNATFKDKIMAELDKLHAATLKVPSNTNPSLYYKENADSFQFLIMYWLAYGAFPATSCNAERIFNIDCLILTNLR